MPIIRLEELELWSKLGKNMYNNDGQLLLSKGAVLEPGLIDRLQALGFNEVYMEEDKPSSGNGEPANQHVEQVFRFCEQSMDEFFSRVNTGVKPNITEVKEAANFLYDEVIQTNNILSQLQALRKVDKYTLQHSVAVSIICLKIGQILKMREDDLRRLSLAGMLHDIGKSKVPLSILNKPGSLTDAEREVMNKHPQFGYEMLKMIDIGDRAIELAVLQHHERLDGKGYPLHFPSEKLHDFARIVAVADIFDAMTSDRVYKPRVSPFQAADELRTMSFGHIDPKITRQFLSYIINIAPGEGVILNNGQAAEIVLVDTAEPSRPLVKVGESFINLKEHRELFIRELMQQI